MLYERLGLPLLDGMREVLEKDVKLRMADVEKKKSEQGKSKRIMWKNARAMDREERYVNAISCSDWLRTAQNNISHCCKCRSDIL